MRENMSIVNIEKNLKVFGLYRGSSIEELKASYRRVAKIYHPDSKKDCGVKIPGVTMSDITVGYKVLTKFFKERSEEDIYANPYMKLTNTSWWKNKDKGSWYLKAEFRVSAISVVSVNDSYFKLTNYYPHKCTIDFSEKNIKMYNNIITVSSSAHGYPFKNSEMIETRSYKVPKRKSYFQKKLDQLLIYLKIKTK